MSIPLEQQRPKQPAQSNSASPNEAIARQVMQAIGEPMNLRRVQVHSLWGDRYRVNVLIGASDTFATVAQSYFLVAQDGLIITSTPALKRVY